MFRFCGELCFGLPFLFWFLDRGTAYGCPPSPPPSNMVLHVWYQFFCLSFKHPTAT